MSEDLKAKPLDIQFLLDYQKDSVVSREVIKKELGTVTFFAFDQGQGLVKLKSQFQVKNIQLKLEKLLSCRLTNHMRCRLKTAHIK